MLTAIEHATGQARLDRAADLLRLTVEGTLEELEAVCHPALVNREALAEPPDARVGGAAGLVGSGRWLRRAFSDLAFTVDEAVVDGDLLVTHGTMSGRHTGPFVVHRADGGVERVFAPTEKTFTVTHTHWLRFADGLLVEHWANRDDQGQALQLGWVPPTPAYLLRCWSARRREVAAG